MKQDDDADMMARGLQFMGYIHSATSNEHSTTNG